MNQDLLDAVSISEYLNGIYSFRATRNSKYSIRAFARDMNLNISQISKVLKGQQGLSAQKASTVSRLLNHSEDEAEIFWGLIEAQFSKSPGKRIAAHERLAFLKSNSHVRQVDAESLNQNLSWLHIAVLEALKGASVSLSQPKIPVLSGVPRDDLKKCLNDLVEWGQAKVERSMVKEISAQSHYGSQIKSETLRRLHKEFMAKAMTSVDEQATSERELFTNVMKFDPKSLKEAKKDIDRFQREFSLKYSASTGKSALYTFCFQFFNLFPSFTEDTHDKK